MRALKIILSSAMVAAPFFSLHGQDSYQAASFAAAAADSIPPKTAIDESKAELKLYPNPVESELKVASEKHDVNRLAIYSSASGELVFLCSIPVPQRAVIIINMSAYPSGYYVVRAWLKGVKKPVSYSVYKI